MNKLQHALIAAAVVSLSLPVAAEGVLAQLYAARPPAGSSFVRLGNPLPTAVATQVAGASKQTLGRGAVAGRYAIVQGNRPFEVRIDGKLAATLSVKPDTFNTLVIGKQGGRYVLTAIDDSGGNQDALKSELRFYNLAGACAGARLRLGSGDATVFDAVAPSPAAARTVNPVAATFSASCGKGPAAHWSMPATQPGDHYSLFLTGTAAAPVLRGQLSATEPYGKAP